MRPAVGPIGRARLFGSIVMVTGTVDVAGAIWPPMAMRLRDVETFLTPTGIHLASGATALLGLALILVGRGVLQRKVFAFRLAVSLLSVSVMGGRSPRDRGGRPVRGGLPPVRPRALRR